MRDTFLELDTVLNDDSVQGKINESISLIPSRYPTKIQSMLYGSSSFLFLEGILAHARETNIHKCVTSSLRPLQAS
jgi:hypothetical protein